MSNSLPPKQSPLTYHSSGVDYDVIDPVKLLAQRAAKETARHLTAHGFQECEASRGESAYVVDIGESYIASITECLGTKALVADEIMVITGRSFYGSIAQDTIAMAVNDLITVGATPLSIHAYFATGSTEWFLDRERAEALIHGWKKACDACQASWGGGETPALSGVVCEDRIDLAASCVGMIRPKSNLVLGETLQAGDSIILLGSSGIHANGISLARKIAGRLPQGYATLMSDGRMYGEGILDPTVLYPQAVRALQKAEIPLHYMANITGHGWRKLMRHPGSFTYTITSVPPVPPVLQFMVEQGPLELAEAYGSLNMGAGFAIFVSGQDAQRTVETVRRAGFEALDAGTVTAGDKKVVIEPLGISFGADTLRLRN